MLWGLQDKTYSKANELQCYLPREDLTAQWDMSMLAWAKNNKQTKLKRWL